MQINKFLAMLFTLSVSQIAWAQAPGGGGHGGHGGDRSSGSFEEATCVKARISKYTPEPLTVVAPGSEFSFFLSGIHDPADIHVSIRQQPVAFTLEDKDNFYVVKGKLPANFKNEAVRISIAANAKYKRCDVEGGWLLKVGE